MSEYIIYTTEGFTQDPNGNDIENCQMFGIAKGKTWIWKVMNVGERLLE